MEFVLIELSPELSFPTSGGSWMYVAFHLGLHLSGLHVSCVLLALPLGNAIVQHSCRCVLPVYLLILSGRRWRKFLCMITAVRLRFAAMSESLHQMNLWCRYCSRFYFFNSREWIETNLSRTPERCFAGFRRLRILLFSRRDSSKMCYYWF